MVVKRSHTAENVAPAIRRLRDQVNAAFPNRLKTTVGHDADGIWPSAAHTAANPNSDHEAGNALDIDDDLSGTQEPPQVTPDLAALISRDPRCHYAIHDSMLYRNGVGAAYGGSSPHTGHVHVSVWEDKRSDAREWDIGEEAAVPDLEYLHISITDRGDPTHRAYLKKVAAPYKFYEGANTFYVDVHSGPQADVFLGYAAKYGMDCESVSTYRGQASTMVLRTKGFPIESDAEIAADLAVALGKIAAAKADLS